MKLNQLFPSEDRAWGKTTIVNEIGFTYQALGYEVLLLTMFPNSNEHFATRYISDENDLNGIRRDKCIAIIDEYDLSNEKQRYLLEIIKQLDIPFVGFAKIYIKPPFYVKIDVEISTIGVIKILVNELMKLLSEYDPNMKVVVVDGRKIIEIDCLGSVIDMHTNESQCTINTTTLWDK